MPLPLPIVPPPGGAGQFPDWRDALSRSRLPRDRRGQFATEIGRFLRYCEILAAPVNWPQARRYLATVPHRMHRPVATQALRWFFRAARAPRRPPPPAPAASVAWWTLLPAEEDADATEMWTEEEPDELAREHTSTLA